MQEVSRDLADEYRRRINFVIDFIDQHLDGPLPLDTLADVAMFSPYHFHRIFRELTGEPPHVYVRRLRLERAVARMRHYPKATLSEIAIDAGFASSSDFSKSFKLVYGLSPRHFSPKRFEQESKIRQDLLANSGQAFRKEFDGRNADNFVVRVERQPQRRIAFVRVIGGFGPKVVAGLERLMSWAATRRIWPGATLIGMSKDDPDTTPMAKYRFDWCLVLPDGFREDRKVSYATLAEGECGIIHCVGDIERVDRAWSMLYRGWLPSSGYQPRNEPAMEIFLGDPSTMDGSHFDLDCCLPIEPLNQR